MGDDPMKVATMHCFEQVPDLKKLNPLVSDRAVRSWRNASRNGPSSGISTRRIC